MHKDCPVHTAAVRDSMADGSGDTEGFSSGETLIVTVAILIIIVGCVGLVWCAAGIAYSMHISMHMDMYFNLPQRLLTPYASYSPWFHSPCFLVMSSLAVFNAPSHAGSSLEKMHLSPQP